MSIRMRRLFYIVGFWTAANLAVTIYWFKLWDALYFNAGFVRFGVTLIGAILGLASLYFVFKEKSKLPPIMAFILVIAFSAFLSTTRQLGGALPRVFTSRNLVMNQQ